MAADAAGIEVAHAEVQWPFAFYRKPAGRSGLYFVAEDLASLLDRICIAPVAVGGHKNRMRPQVRPLESLPLMAVSLLCSSLVLWLFDRALHIVVWSVEELDSNHSTNLPLSRNHNAVLGRPH